MHNNKAPLIIGFPEYVHQAQLLADLLNMQMKVVLIHRFPDGESKITVPTPIPEHIILVRSLDHPNDKLVELLLTCATARSLGAVRITLVAPYLCYMRQDKAFRPGEAISQRIIGAFIGDWMESLITVDPHLHRIHHLTDAVPIETAISLTASELLGEFLSERLDHPLLLGPDAESRQWVEMVARPQQLEYTIAHKTRLGDRQVKIDLERKENFNNRDVVLIDDVASTGHTLCTACEHAKAAGARKVYAFVTHALFSDATAARLKKAGIDLIWSTDSIPHSSNALSLAPLLANAIQRIL
jgi:ribose-phosphate pyrophosphokinase